MSFGRLCGWGFAGTVGLVIIIGALFFGVREMMPPVETPDYIADSLDFGSEEAVIEAAAPWYNNGLFSEHPLTALSSGKPLGMSIEGFSELGYGSISGSLQSEVKILFAAEQWEQIWLYILPYDRVSFKIGVPDAVFRDGAAAKATVRFKYDLGDLREGTRPYYAAIVSATIQVSKPAMESQIYAKIFR